MTPLEAARLGTAAAILQPLWDAQSVKTILLDPHQPTRHRPAQDVAAALGWLALDPDTRTPARIHEPGPWWPALTAGNEGGMRGVTCPRCRETWMPNPDTPPHECTRTGRQSSAIGIRMLRAAKASRDGRPVCWWCALGYCEACGPDCWDPYTLDPDSCTCSHRMAKATA